MPRLQVGTEKGTPIELHYQDRGTGRPVVLMHGWPLSGRIWEKQVPVLVDAGYRAITYDRRGFGASSQPWEGYDIDTFAADLHALLEHLDLTDAVLVGHSMASGEVVRYLSTYGTQRVSAAVLAGGVPPNLFKSDDNPEGPLDDSYITGTQEAIRNDRLAFIDGLLVSFFGAGERTDLVTPPTLYYYRQIASAASPKATIDCVDVWGRTDFRADLAKLTVPTLVIHGDSDGIVPFQVSGQRSHEMIKGSHLVVVQGGGHGFPVTHAKEFNTALLDFLS